MLDHELVKKTEAFLKQKFDTAKYLSEHPEDKAYRIEHTYRVANIGREIAVKEGFDEREVPFGTKTADALWQSRPEFYIVLFQKPADQLKKSKCVMDD